MADHKEEKIAKKHPEEAKGKQQNDGQISEADLKKVSGGGTKDHSI